MKSRKLDDHLFGALTHGVLQPVCVAIAQDDTLMPGLRDKRLDIYYRGGVLLSLFDNGEARPFTTWYDPQYAKHDEAGAIAIQTEISDPAQAALLVGQIYGLKRQIDRHRFSGPKGEKEVQQLIVHENNLSTVAHETDYFIADIELADTSLGAQFDMAAVRWQDRRKGGHPVMVPVLIEVKHGIGALQGRAGLTKHLADMRAMIAATAEWLAYLDDLEKQLAQLAALGAMRWNKGVQERMTIARDATPEVLFILANCNPASTKLLTFLDGIGDVEPSACGFDLRFAVSCFAGYGLYHASMLRPGAFRDLVNGLLPIAKRQSLAAPAEPTD